MALEWQSPELADTYFAKILRQLMYVFLLYRSILLETDELKHVP